MAVKVQHLRSSVASKRPVASSLLAGEIALNVESTSSGAYVADAAGTGLLKIGAAEVGSSAPNSSPAGASGNSRGEFWLDTANAAGNGSDVLKIFNGTGFVVAGTTTIGTTDIDLGGSSTTLVGLTNVSTALLTLPGSTSGNVTLKAAAASDGTNYVWPATDGADTHVLATNGSGALTWQEARTNDITNGGSSISIDGNGLISIDTVNGGNWTFDLDGNFIPGGGENIGEPGNEVGNIYANNFTGGTYTGTWNGDIITTEYGGTGIDNSAATDGQILIASANGVNDATFASASLVGGQSLTITEGAGTLQVDADFASAAAASAAANAGVASFDSAKFTVDASGFVSLNGAGALQTLSGDSGGAIDPVAGNIDLSGGQSIVTTGTAGDITFDAVIATAGSGSGTIGVSSFDSSQFIVTAGHVTLNPVAVASTYTDDNGATAVPANGNLNLVTGVGLTSVAAGDAVTFTLDDTAVTAAAYGAADTVGTFTVDAQGRLTAAADVTIDILASQVSDFDAQVLSHTLDEFTMPCAGEIDMGGFKIVNLGAPTADGDAVNKLYVDQVAQGLDVKQSVTVATAGVLDATYANGTGGVGATLSNNGVQAALQIDGEALNVGDRVLVKDQGAVTSSNSLQNGIYVVTIVGSASTNWELTRSTDMDEAANVPGAFAFVESGSTNASNGYVCITEPPITMGTTEILWEQFSGAGQILAGDGLSKSGNQLNVNVDSRAAGTKTTAIVNDEVRVDAAWEGQTSLTTLGTITTGTWNGDILGLSYGGTGVDNTNIAEGMVYMGPNYTGSNPNGSAAFKEILTTDIAPITGGSFDAGTF